MARSLYKKFFWTYDDMYLYYNRSILENRSYDVRHDREKTINGITYWYWFSIHNGRKYPTEYKSSRFNIGYKLGMFAKTRKPFFFRSKRKKR